MLTYTAAVISQQNRTALFFAPQSAAYTDTCSHTQAFTCSHTQVFTHNRLLSCLPQLLASLFVTNDTHSQTHIYTHTLIHTRRRDLFLALQWNGTYTYIHIYIHTYSYTISHIMSSRHSAYSLVPRSSGQVCHGKEGGVRYVRASFVLQQDYKCGSCEFIQSGRR